MWWEEQTFIISGTIIVYVETNYKQLSIRTKKNVIKLARMEINKQT